MGFLANQAADDFGRDPNNKGYDPANQAAADEKAAGQEQYAKGADVTAQAQPVTDASVQAQQDIAKTASEGATKSFEDYQKLFAQVSADATNFDSPEQMARVRQGAAGNANAAFDAAENSRRVELTRMGVNPGSARFGAPDNSASLIRAAGVAGAMNEATAGREAGGIQLRGQAAGMASSAAGAGAQIGLDASRGSVATKVAGLNAGLPWYQAGNSMTQGAAANMASIYGTATKAYGDSLDYAMKTKQLTADEINKWGSSAMGGGMQSSKTVKTDKRKVDDEAVLEKVKRVPVGRWRYKKGAGDEGEHIGAYAEDVQREFGDTVAPGGRVIDVISMHGIALAGIRALAKKVDRIEKTAGGR